MGRKLIKVSKNTAIVIEPFKNDYGNYVGVREFYKPKNDEDGEWRPTMKGLSIPLPEDGDEKDIPKKVRNAIKWAVENFEEEHKVLESKGKKKKKDDEDEKPSKKSKSNKKSKKAKDDDDEDD